MADRDPTDLAHALAVLRERLEHEFNVTERLDSKSRQAFALAASSFVVAQASAFASFGAAAVTSSERVVMLVTALLAGAALAFVSLRLYESERTRPEENVSPKAIREWCRVNAVPGMVSAHLVWALSEVAQHRIASNASRHAQTERVHAATRLTLALSGLVLVVAMSTRI